MSRSSRWYRKAPIGSPLALSKALGIDLSELLHLAENTAQYYSKPIPKTKPDGSIRYVYEAYGRLKEAHLRINARIFKSIDYPDYLMGGLPKRSHFKNADRHKNAMVLIGEDIASFWPSRNWRARLDSNQ